MRTLLAFIVAPNGRSPIEARTTVRLTSSEPCRPIGPVIRESRTAPLPLTAVTPAAPVPSATSTTTPSSTEPESSSTKPEVPVALSGPVTATSVASALFFSRIPSVVGSVARTVRCLTDEAGLLR